MRPIPLAALDDVIIEAVHHGPCAPASGRMEGKKFIYASPLDHPTTSGPELKSLRVEIAGIQNDIAAREKLGVYLEYLSFKARGIDKEATQHRGRNATAMERRGM